jgi:hypothetical protein
MSVPLVHSRWSWSPPTVLASVPSRATLLAVARRRQHALVRQWRQQGRALLTRLEQTLDAASISAEEAQAEQIRSTAPLGILLQPHTGLGQARRSTRTTDSPETLHAQLHARYARVGRQIEGAAAAAASDQMK